MDDFVINELYDIRDLIDYIRNDIGVPFDTRLDEAYDRITALLEEYE